MWAEPTSISNGGTPLVGVPPLRSDAALFLLQAVAPPPFPPEVLFSASGLNTPPPRGCLTVISSSLPLMHRTPNSYELPAAMKRAGVRPVPPPPPGPMCCAPACMLAVSCAFLFLFGLAFHPYPERMEPGFWKWLAGCSGILIIPVFFGWLMSLAFSLLSVIMSWSRFRNTLVLVLCFCAPPVALLFGAMLKCCLCPSCNVY